MSLRCMAGVTRKATLTSEEVAKMCKLKKLQWKMRQRRLQCVGHVSMEAEVGGG